MERETLYSVELPHFQGPLDLLLTLIEGESLDITKISLAKVTNQYLASLEKMQELNPDELTDFLVIAGKLILIKSEVLLPRQPKIVDKDEENVGEELARQLMLYKRFKEIAAQLHQVADDGLRGFVRAAPPLKVEPTLTPGEGNLAQLVAVARAAFAVTPPEPNVDEVVARQTVTIGQQMFRVREMLRDTDRPFNFYSLLSQQCTQIEVIVTLLAVLELIKRHYIVAEQHGNFGPIFISRDQHSPRLTEADWENLAEQVELS